MKNIFLKTIGLTAFTLVVLFAAQIAVTAQEQERNELLQAQSHQGTNSIIGVWEATVTPRNCQTGEPAGASFQSLVTFHKGGTMSEYGANPATPFRSNGQGIWQRAYGDDSYYQRFVFFPLTSGGVPVGKLKVTQTAQHNRYTDEFTSSGTFQLFNPAGIVINSGCSSATSVRFR